MTGKHSLDDVKDSEDRSIKQIRKNEEDALNIVTLPQLTFPDRQTLSRICEEVYHRLLNNDAIADLSLPPKKFLEMIPLNVVLSRVEFSFEKVIANNPFDVPTSYTLEGHGNVPTYVKINYSKVEAESRPQIILGRIYHEVTHAIRCELVRRCQYFPDVPEGCKKKLTPSKEPKDRVLNDLLFKLEETKFHSGYWIEHELLHGIWVTLTGYLIKNNDEVVVIPQQGVLFHVRKRTGEQRAVIVEGEEEDFIELEGRYSESGDWIRLFHCGLRTSRNDTSEECSHML